MIEEEKLYELTKQKLITICEKLLKRGINHIQHLKPEDTKKVGNNAYITTLDPLLTSTK
jgi:hypothetical protein